MQSSGSSASLDACILLLQTVYVRLAGLVSVKEGLVRLAADVTAAEIERTLRLMAEDQFGPQRASQLEHRLAHYAQMLARIATASVEFGGDPPDLSGVEEDDDRD